MSEPLIPTDAPSSDGVKGDETLDAIVPPLLNLPSPNVEPVSETDDGSDSDDDDDDLMPQELRQIDIERGVSLSGDKYCNNVVITSRYTAWNFVPKNLFEQFSEVSNLYFLFIGLLQIVPEISTTQGLPTIYMPLAFIVFVSAIRAAVEDVKRHRADTKTSSTPYLVYTKHGRNFHHKRSGDISVGDIIMIKKDQTVPADMILLSTSDKRNGQAFIDKKSLNGETSLEIMLACRETYDTYNHPDAISHLKCNVAVLPPNGVFDLFTGVLTLYSSKDEIMQSAQNWTHALSPRDPVSGRRNSVGETQTSDNAAFGTDISEVEAPHHIQIPLHSKMLLLRETTLRSTEWAIGLVVYTGKDTKIRQNVLDSRLTRKWWQKNDIKRTRIFSLVETLLVYMLILQIILCLVAGIVAGIWHSGHADDWYLRFPDNSATTGLLSFFSFFIILSQMVPISLIVSAELVKMFLSLLIEEDHSMYSFEKDERVKCNKSVIHEDLGQIDYVLSDKTGTLTKNKMEFRFALIMGDEDEPNTYLPTHSFETLQGNVSLPNQPTETNQFKNVVCFGKMETEISKRAQQRELEYKEEQLAKEEGRRVRPRPVHLWTELVKSIHEDTSRSAGFAHQQQVLNVLWGPLVSLEAQRQSQLQLLHQQELDNHASNTSSIGSSVDGMDLHHDDRIYSTNPPQQEHIHHDSPWLHPEYTHRREIDGAERYRLFRYLINCALSNTVNPYMDSYGQLQYTTESADELALVLFAKKMGIVLYERDADDLSVYSIKIEKHGRGEDEIHYYKKLGIFHFTSERKRVTVICERVRKEITVDQYGKTRNTYTSMPDPEIYVMSKGQDTVMMNLLYSSKKDWSKLQRATQHLCKAGLRTMLLSEARVSKSWWSQKFSEYELLDNMVMDRTRNDRAALQNQLDDLKTKIEVDSKLRLLGATGLEDELQDLVPECISDLLRAGIKVWMLTGDKKETAKNIAMACCLIDPDMLPDVEKLSQIRYSDPKDLVSQVNDLMASSRVLEVTGEWATLSRSPQVLNDLFEYFSSLNTHTNTKQVGYTDLLALLAGVGAQDQDSTSSASTSLRMMFDVYDADHDGYIDFQQFCQFMHEVQVSPFDAIELDVLRALKTAEEMLKKNLSVSLVVTKEAFSVICPPPRVDNRLNKRKKRTNHSGASTPGFDSLPSPLFPHSPSMSGASFPNGTDPLSPSLSPLGSPMMGSPMVPNVFTLDPSINIARRRILRYKFFQLAAVCRSVVFAGAEPPMKERMVRELSERCKYTMQHPQSWAFPPSAYVVRSNGMLSDQLKPHIKPPPSKVEGSVVLAIGDGANDELMIKAANIGIGISGVEGAAAVKAADYAIAQFSFLHTLLFVHGVWCYTRISYLVQFVFYKAALVALTMFFFGFFSGFSGQQLFNEPIYQFFNILFTAFPVLVIAIFERILDRDTLENNPEVYKALRKEKFFSSRTFVYWILRAVGHAAVIFFVGYLCLSVNNVSNEDGKEHGLYLVAATIYMCVVFLATVIVFLDMYSVTWLHIASLIFSIISFFFIVVLFSIFNDFNVTLYGVIIRMLVSPTVWLVACVTTLFPLLLDIAARHVYYLRGKGLVQILRENQKVQYKRQKLVTSLQNETPAERFRQMQEFDAKYPPLPDLRLYKPFHDVSDKEEEMKILYNDANKMLYNMKSPEQEALSMDSAGDTDGGVLAEDQFNLDGVVSALNATSPKEEGASDPSLKYGHLQRAIVATLLRFRNLTGSYFESAEWQKGLDTRSRDYVIKF